MTVEQLLSENIRMPEFRCAVFRPAAGSLRYTFENDELVIYADGYEQFKEEDFQPFQPIEAEVDILRINQDKILDKLKNAYIENIKKLLMTNNPYDHSPWIAFNTSSVDMLIDLIVIAEDFFQHDLSYKTDMLLSFCNKYGFPTLEMPYVEGKGYVPGVTGSSFWPRLGKLFMSYALWKALYVGEYDSLQLVWPFMSKKPCPSAPSPSADQDLQKYLEISAEVNVNLGLRIEEDKNSLSYQTNDILAIAEAQLLMLISRGERYMEHGMIAFCEYCGQPFIRKKSDRTSCDFCQLPAEKQKRYRERTKAKKQKGEMNNG